MCKNVQKFTEQKIPEYRSAFRILPNIYDGVFSHKWLKIKVANYLSKNIIL